MNDLFERILKDGYFMEIGKDGGNYVAKLFKKGHSELAEAFGRGDTLQEALEVLESKL
jgi:hypothetical protein